MSKHGIAKRYRVNRAELNSILRVVLIEEAVRAHLKGEPGTFEQLCGAIDREDAERHRGEHWSVARDYVRSRLRRLA
jgi:hypothetical protein